MVMLGIQLDTYCISTNRGAQDIRRRETLQGQNPSDLTNNLSVLRKCKNKFDCLVHEMLLITQYILTYFTIITMCE